ncbi:ABC transporter ATP-binding protein [Kurthia sibirica]|uniref:ABC transporter ATP-binding protein n=1 Tax=Kurthia sibirica TaxID=202750 RepID=A0A2U3AQD4_9BACL|nr:ABC transporter ATP-binding protein [Kurthia sibirica]PWI26753.1 ABC transporter ATP-binding protein [Kurthia sibirica]GEK32717.1 ABC transporter [Kurthia sibirica]
MIEINNLTKLYGSFKAVDNLSLTIDKGTVYGFVGANGAGKTTTFNMIATLLQPTSGDVVIAGKSIVNESHEVRKKIGYMPDFFGVYDQLKANEYLNFFGTSYQMTQAEIAKQIPVVLNLVNLIDKRYDYVDDLSRGMKQRLCLARTLMHDPEVLILDEPASGLDPRARVELRDVLISLKKMGKTIIISSHILPELAEICDEIGVLDNGKLIASGNIASIQQQLSADKTLIIQLISEVDHQETIQFFKEQQLSVERQANGQLHVHFTGSEQQQQQLLLEALRANLPIIGFMEDKKNLEDVFMAITKGGKLDERTE